MLNIRDLKKKKQLSQTLYKFARGMEILSSSKMSLRKKDLDQLSIYTSELSMLIQHALPFLSKEEIQNSPLFNPVSTNPKAVVVFFSDMGMCGNYNELILTSIRRLNLTDRDYIFSVGAMGISFLNRIGLKPDGNIGGLYSEPDISIVSSFFMDILTVPFRQLSVVYIHADVGRPGIPKIENLLPIKIEKKAQTLESFELIPNPYSIVAQGAKMFVYSSMLKAFFTAAFSEFNMRWITMSRTEKQAKEMSKKIQIQISRIRRELITREIIDTIGGIIHDSKTQR